MSGRPEPSTVTIVIPTRGRARKLEALLDSIARNAGPRLARVVVVSDDADSVSPVHDARSVPVELISLPERAFMSRAKNVGLRSVTTEFTFFIDDDNILPPATLDLLATVLDRQWAVAAVMPSVLYRARPDLVWVYATPLRPDRWEFELVGRNRPRDPSSEGRLLATDALPNASMFRTDAFRAIGGYDERYVVNSSADACLRLRRAGWDVRAFSGAFVLHDVEAPGGNGYWAEHTVQDPERAYHEIQDWFRFRRLLHPNALFFRTRATAHATRFVAGWMIASWVRPNAPRLRLIRRVARGYLAALGGSGDL